MDSIFRDLADPYRRSRRRARSIWFTFSAGPFKIRGDNTMTFSMQAGSPGAFVKGSPVDANNGPSKAVMSNQVFTSSDPTIFTVVPDPATPGGAIIRPVAAPATGQVQATLTETATATEPDGTTTEKIQGVSTIIVTAAPPPPPPPAASIVFTFTPITVPPPPPPPPPVV